MTEHPAFAGGREALVPRTEEKQIMRWKALTVAMVTTLPAMASAQSVTLYGLIDTGVEVVNHIGIAQNTVVRQPNLTGTVPSRWGMRGSEDLGGGLKSNFMLESGFGADTGASANGGRLFGRQAWVGLSGPWGEVAIGRQFTMLFWATLDADILGPNIFGSGSLDPTIPNARMDNGISYKGKFGGLTLGATYSFGRDTATSPLGPGATNCAGENPEDKRACREWSAMALYETPRFGVSALYESVRGGPGAYGGLNTSAKTDDRIALTSYALLDKAKVGAGWVRHDNQGIPTPKSDLYWVGLTYDIAPALSIAGQVYHQRYHGSANKSWLYAMRATYSLSKRTSLYATAGFIDNGGQLTTSVTSSPGSNTSPGGTQLGAMLGIKQIF